MMAGTSKIHSKMYRNSVTWWSKLKKSDLKVMGSLFFIRLRFTLSYALPFFCIWREVFPINYLKYKELRTKYIINCTTLCILNLNCNFARLNEIFYSLPSHYFLSANNNILRFIIILLAPTIEPTIIGWCLWFLYVKCEQL